MNSLRESVYAHPEAKGVVVLNWLDEDQQLYGDEEDEEDKTAVRATVYFPNLHIKDIYMDLLLGVNEDFDDDLLDDAMALLAE